MSTTLFTVEGVVLKPPAAVYQPIEPFIRVVRAASAADARKIVLQSSSPLAPILVDAVRARA